MRGLFYQSNARRHGLKGGILPVFDMPQAVRLTRQDAQKQKANSWELAFC
jgi:hypothetical protein